METSSKIAQTSDSLIDLLTAQCADLEKLLVLARQESIAAEAGNFGTILDITFKRAEIGKRLETFHRQIAELRGFLEKNSENSFKYNETANRAVELANLTLVQDRETRLLLTAAREETNLELKKLEFGNRSANIYLREQKKGLTYDGDF